MDGYQQHHRYIRPPQPPQVPPSTTDPHHYHHQPRPPVPPQGTWYTNQFQYHPPPPPSSSSHSPSPPPPQQWAAPPHSDHFGPPTSAYPQPPPPPHTYPTHLPPQNHQFPPPPPPPPPRPNPPPLPQSYPQVNQEWGNPNWVQHQAWDYPAHNNAEDWAAKARAWAAAKKVAMEDQHPHSHFTAVGKPEEQNRYYDQYPQAVDSHYQDIQQQPFPASGYQQFPVSTASSHHPPTVYPQESAYFNSGQSSYVPDGHLPYNVGNGTSAGAPTANPSVHQQEVPSSYSSVTGKEETADQKEQLYKSLPLPIASTQEGQHHLQPALPAIGRSVFTEQPFAYGNQAADAKSDLSDQPLDFAPSFSRDQDPHMQSSYASHHDSAGTVRGIGSITPVPSINSWTPAVTTGAVYPSIPPALPSGPQHDPSIAVPSSVSGHSVPPFGSFTGSSFQPTIPPSGAPYGLGAGTALPPTAGFPGDAYGVSNISERPKKASVPNWLKEEIIKNASVITRSSLEHPKGETQSAEDEGADKSFGKGDQADSKSIDSSRSTEEEEDDEDYVEAARTAAINQEIKRVLTEVLLKVTDELFDEIATKVLNEDDLTVEVEHNTFISNQKLSPSPPAVPTPKASAKVLVPVKAKESKAEDVGERSRSSSSSPGNVLGLANYASDEDDDEIQSSSVSNSKKNAVHEQLGIPKVSEDMHDAGENGISHAELGKSTETKLASDLSKATSTESNNKLIDASEHAYSSKVVSGARDVEISVDNGKTLESNTGFGSKATLRENVTMNSEPFGENVSMKKSKVDDSQGRETRMRSDEVNRHESRPSNPGKDIVEAGFGSREDVKGGDNRRRRDEKHLRKDKTDDQNGSKEGKKERGDNTGDKTKESEPRKKSSYLDVKEDTKEAHRGNAKEDTNKKRERVKDKEEDRARHKHTSDSSKHKRRRSSSISSRGRNSKDNDSSDEASDDSKRKLHSRKRHASPSAVRSRRRQVSRSPHSKHSQRRHSPYSSLETTRGRRSRSKSPVRRRR